MLKGSGASYCRCLPALPQGTGGQQCLDFDDLRYSVQLLQQNEQVQLLVPPVSSCSCNGIRTPTVQYDLIKLLVVDGKDPQDYEDQQPFGVCGGRC